MPTIEEVKKRFDWCGDEHVAVAIWSEEDVFSRAKERGMIITREEAQAVLANMDYKQDCSMGISWDTMDVYLDEIEEEKEDDNN